MNRYLLFWFCFTIILFTVTQSQVIQNMSGQKNSEFFIENKGQWPTEVKFLSQIGGMNAWITHSGVVYDYYQIICDNTTANESLNPIKRNKEPKLQNSRIKGHVVRAMLESANVSAVASGKNELEAYYNYFIGDDAGKWASYVKLYREVEIKDIYKGIDIRYYFDNGLVRYDYQVAAGADLSRIQIRLDGADGYQVNRDGELVIRTSLGEVRHGKLYAYQMIKGHQQEIHCRFKEKMDGSLGIHAARYDQNRVIIIDPLVYSTYLGSNQRDQGSGIAIDESGYAYITGSTYSSYYPVSAGAYDRSFGDAPDAFVTKLNSSGSQIIYSTFLGGNSDDWGYDIVIDREGNAYITGTTYSTDFPVSSSAYARTNCGTNDGFVTKLNSAGSGLIYSTYIGGGLNDDPESIVVDNSGQVYIVGTTNSSLAGANAFPTTSGAFDQTHNGSGSNDIFITKFNTSGTGLVYSTLIGGTLHDYGNAIDIDENGNAYITGETTSSDYPTTLNAYDQLHNHNLDVIVTKLNSTGSRLVYSTFLGGSGNDRGYALCVDRQGNAYIAGFAQTGFPTTAGVYDQSLNGPGDCFLTKLNSFGSDLHFSTFLGGNSDNEIAKYVGLDQGGNLLVAGRTKSTDFPTTSDAYDRTHNGDQDVFIAKFNLSASELSYSTFIGGTRGEECSGMTIDGNGALYITGSTESNDFPTTNNVYDPNFNGGSSDAYVTKISFSAGSPTWIRLTSPNGGEVWYVGNQYDIRWEASQYIGQVKVFISSNGGQNWWELHPGMPNDGHCIFIPNQTSNNCLFKIASVENPSIYDQSDAPFAILDQTAYSISGNVAYYNNSKPVKNVTLKLNETTTNTGNDGSFSFNNLTSSNYTLLPTKTGDVNAAIGAYDASMILRYTVGLIDLTPQQLLAGDVSANGSVAAFDASYILRYTVGLITSFPVNAEWRFVPASFSLTSSNWNSAPDKIDYSPLNSTQSNQNFTALVYGDVSGNWSSTSLEKKYTGHAAISFGAQQRLDETKLTVPVNVDISGELFAAEIIFSVDAEKIKVQDVRLGEKLNDYHLAWSQENGKLRIALAGAEPVQAQDVELINLNFEAKEPASNTPINLELTEVVLNEGQISAEISNRFLAIESIIPTTYRLFQNSPNPFNPTTSIQYHLAETADVALTIFDLAGKEVKKYQNNSQTAGQYTIDWNSRDASGQQVASGMYFCLLEILPKSPAAKRFTAVKKMILMK
ncbi:SBBP repeat-containing protein [candidate division KSB1 bacterium]|nr:SBBP repeat-containing protein [candidate division KSB1 bacterium]